MAGGEGGLDERRWFAIGGPGGAGRSLMGFDERGADRILELVGSATFGTSVVRPAWPMIKYRYRFQGIVILYARIWKDKDSHPL